uniref:Uncharacterized protein n=1 Tax=Cacopsylla melanoneura TaxID=428564 RepID=A0A8D8UHV7_9HEMI
MALETPVVRITDRISVVGSGLESRENFPFLCRSKNYRLLVNLKVLGTDVLGLIDTGAAHSYMSGPCYKRLSFLNLSRYSIPEEGVILADGYVQRVNTVLSLPVQLHHKGQPMSVRCLPTLSTELVLGMDFIRAMRMVIDAEEDSFTFKEDAFKKFQFIPEQLPGGSPCAGILQATKSQKEEVDCIVAHAQALEPKGKVRTNRMVYEIKLTDYTPIKQGPYPVNPRLQEIITKEVDEMLKDGVIRPSSSDWSNPLLVVTKADGSYKFGNDKFPFLICLKLSRDYFVSFDRVHVWGFQCR